MRTGKMTPRPARFVSYFLFLIIIQPLLQPALRAQAIADERWSVTTIAGQAGKSGNQDGPGPTSLLTRPSAVWGRGTTLYFGDAATIKRVDLTSGIVTTEYVPPDPPRSYRSLVGLSGDSTYLYLTDGSIFSGSIWRYLAPPAIMMAGQSYCSIPGCSTLGFSDGSGVSALFNNPSETWFDGTALYVSDTGNRAIRKVIFTPTVVSTVLKTGLQEPRGIWGDGTSLYIADVGKHAIYKLSLSTGALTLLSGTPGVPGYRDGSGTSSYFNMPTGMSGDGRNLYITESRNHTVRKVVIATGDTFTVAGEGGERGGTDGVGAAARFSTPGAIWCDGSVLYVADRENYTIRQIRRARTPADYSLKEAGSVSLTSVGASSTVTVGSTQILADIATASPQGLAIFALRQNGVLVTEAAVPSSPLLRSGRTFAQVTGGLKTGVAVANPNFSPATVTFSITNSVGTQSASGSFTVPANGQLSRFIDESPFNSGSLTEGALTLNSDQPVGMIALRGRTNERSEFLITTVPFVSLAQPLDTSLLPHWADGGGWRTDLLLVNPFNESISGFVEFWDNGINGSPSAITVVNQTRIPYTVPANGAKRIETPNIEPTTQVGTIHITPVGGSRGPAASAVFSYSQTGVTVTEAGVTAIPGSRSFRLYVETSGNFKDRELGSVQTGIAVANTSGDTVTINVELNNPDGSLRSEKGSISIAPGGQTSLFLFQIAGLETIPNRFVGTVRLWSEAGTFSVLGLRGRYNERADFLITTTTPANDLAAPSSAAHIFPHWVDGSGYTTQFVLFSATPGRIASGLLEFYLPNGTRLQSPFR